MEIRYMRNPAVVMMCRRRSCIFIQEGVEPFVVSDVDTSILLRLMRICVLPVAEQEVNALINNNLRALLIEHKVLVCAPEPVLKLLRSGPSNEGKPCNRIVLGLTGAIASLKMVPIALEMQSRLANEVDVVLTRGAMHMLKPEAFSFLGLRIWSDSMLTVGNINVPHIHLAQGADLVVVMPASARTLHKIAHGACSDLLSLTIAATRAPVILFPAMNGVMWDSPSIARNVNQLREDGYYVVEPEQGGEVSTSHGHHLSYGVAGAGGMAVVEILRQVLGLLPQRQH